MASLEELAATIVDHWLAREPASGRTRVLAIDGPSGAGKTTLAEAVRETTRADVLHLEDLYRGWHGLETAPLAAERILSAIAVDAIGHAPRWDWGHEAVGPDLVVPPSELLIVEGVGAGARVLAPFTSLLVWVDGDEATRKQRALARDGDTYAPWWGVWAAQERLHFSREVTRSRADLHLTIGPLAPPTDIDRPH